jgi:Skp family chaperone for outer membrane proteins
VRENAEHAVASLRSALALAEADIEAAQQAVTSFEADNRRLEALRRRLRATERRESKQVICNWIAWLQWHAAALFLAFNQFESAGVLAVLGLIAKLFDWFYRFNFVNIAKLEADIMQLEHSVLGGPSRRSAWLLAARQSREQTAKRLDKALVQLARVQEREARAHAYWQAVEVGLEAARREFEERQQQAAAIRAAIEAKRAELVEQRSQLEAYHLRRVHELATHKQALDAFATRHRGAVKALRDQEREAQLQRHLDQFFITSEKFEGIGVVLMSTLASFGIETAADITEESVMAVPGFGPARTQTLLDWRRSKEAGFRFVAGQIDPAKRAALERRHAIERREAERHLRVGQTDLEARAKTFADAVADYRRAVEAEAMALALAEHEAALVSGRIRGRPW